VTLQPTHSKWVECTKCGWIGRASVFFALSWSWCDGCGALGYNLRILRNTEGKPINDAGNLINIRTGKEVPK
jgi:hypothetical protein